MFILLLGWLWLRFAAPKVWGNYGNRTSFPDTHFSRCPPKPEWVRKKIIRLKALMPEAGCRSIAHAFNRLHERKGMTVGKSYVNEVVRKHRCEIQILRRKIKHRRPRPVPHNLVWGVDLTGKTDAAGNLHNILGIVEHRSRASLTLAALADKASITLLDASLPPSGGMTNRNASVRTTKPSSHQDSFVSGCGCSASSTIEPRFPALGKMER